MKFRFAILASLPLLLAATYQAGFFGPHVKALQDSAGVAITIERQIVGDTLSEETLVLGKNGQIRWESPTHLLVSNGETVWSLDKDKNIYTEEPAKLPDLTKPDAIWPWAAAVDPNWSKQGLRPKRVGKINFRKIKSTHIEIINRNSGQKFGLIINDETKLIHGAIIPPAKAGQKEQILYAKKLELLKEAPSEDSFTFEAPAGAKLASEVVEASGASFADALAVLKQSCSNCHGAGLQRARLRLDSYEAIMRGGQNGPAVVPGDAAKSRLIMRMQHDRAPMPPTGKLPQSQIDVVSAWINAGAKNE